MNGDTIPAYQAVDDYLDDLLGDAPVQPSARASDDDLAWPPKSAGYLMCTAAGVLIAMPMGQVADILLTPMGDGDELQASDGDIDRRVRVVDLSRILADDLREPAADMLVVLSGWRWALACRSTEEEASHIANKDVNWRVAREERIRRPWLGGMFKSGHCAVLDVVELMDMLDREYQGNAGA
jgi:hypothetical protein